MTTDVELLPLPEVLPFSAAGARKVLQDWCRTCVAHATAAKDAEIEALRAEIEALRAINDNREAIIATHAADTREYQKQIMHAEARAERLAEALRDIESRPWNGVRPIQIAARAALRDHDQEGKDG